MDREEIARAAQDYAGIKVTMQESAELKRLGAYCWTTEELIAFAIQISNKKLEEAKATTTNFRTRRDIENLKIKDM